MESLLNNYPELFAILLILAGFAAGAVLSRVVAKLLQLLNEWVRRRLPSVTVASVRTEVFIQRLVYYLTIAVFLLFALRVLGIGELSNLLDLAIVFIPGLVSGAIIILLGYLVSVFVYHAVFNSPWSGNNQLVARSAQLVVVTIALLTGLSQMSVDVSLIGQALVVIMLVTLGGMALAFALGSGSYVSNVLARRVFRDFAIGDHIRIGDMEGTILEFKQTSVLIQTDEGVAVVPATTFADSIVVRLTAG